jgi:hypothetical protein
VAVVRRLRSRPRIERAVEALRYGSNVHESVRFALRELAGRGQVASYRMRTSGLRCFVRHDGHDAWVLHEIFGKRAYAFPPQVAAVLGGAEQGPRVVDVGGHLGLFGLYVLSSFPTARITSFEPDPENAALLERTVRANGLGSRWEVVRAAASTSAARVSFVAGLGERSLYSTGSTALTSSSSTSRVESGGSSPTRGFSRSQPRRLSSSTTRTCAPSLIRNGPRQSG